MKIRKDIKNNIGIILSGLNMLLIIFVINGQESQNSINMISINPKNRLNKEDLLKKAICIKAFESLKEGKPNSNLIHPDILKGIENNSFDFDFTTTKEIYTKLMGGPLCRIVLKVENGFVGFKASLQLDGPLIYRITYIEDQVPTKNEVEAL